MNRHEGQKGGPKRPQKFLRVRPTILVACEGEQTEPNYVNGFFKDLCTKRIISPQSYAFAPHQHTDPCGVLKDLLSYKRNGLRSEDFTQKWIFIDRDEIRTNCGSGHTKENFNKAIADAKSKNVNVVWSNPCFEIWFLLHFEFRNTPVDRAELPAILSKHLETEYRKNHPDMYSFLKPKFETAMNNAEKLLAKASNPSEANPATSIPIFFKNFR